VAANTVGYAADFLSHLSNPIAGISAFLGVSMSHIQYGTPREAEEAFYRAIEQADLGAMMSVWSDDDATVCIHPGAPRLEGRQLIEESWQEIFESGPNMEFSLSDERITQDSHLAIHLVREEIAIGGELVSVMLSTNIYHLGASGWRMMLHHSSPEPELHMDEFDMATEDEPLVLH
jgi:ketosteroid isomerase-like protein